MYRGVQEASVSFYSVMVKSNAVIALVEIKLDGDHLSQRVHGSPPNL